MTALIKKIDILFIRILIDFNLKHRSSQILRSKLQLRLLARLCLCQVKQAGPALHGHYHCTLFSHVLAFILCCAPEDSRALTGIVDFLCLRAIDIFLYGCYEQFFFVIEFTSSTKIPQVGSSLLYLFHYICCLRK